MTEDLWGELPNTDNIRTSFTVLKEQADLLAKKSHGILIGEIENRQETFQTEKGGNFIESTLYIFVPALSYRYGVVTLRHQVDQYYPVVIDDINELIQQNKKNCSNEKELKETLRRILQASKLQNVIYNLLIRVCEIQEHA
jgi:hypothetical protein